MKTSQKFITTFVSLATLIMLGCGNSSSNPDANKSAVEVSNVAGACTSVGSPGYFPLSCIDYYDLKTVDAMKNFCEDNAEFSEWLDKCPSNKIVGGCFSEISNTVTWYYGFAAIDLKESCKRENSQWVNDKATAEALIKVQ